MAEIAAAGAALANGAGSLFSYNKDVFVFDQTLRQQKVHQIQNIRLQQVLRGNFHISFSSAK